MDGFDEKTTTEIRLQVATAREAAVEIAKQASVLWEARLNMAMAVGDRAAVSAMLRNQRAEAYMDNCNCGGGGGGTSYLD